MNLIRIILINRILKELASYSPDSTKIRKFFYFIQFIQNKESITGAVLKEGNISTALSNPLTQRYFVYEISVRNGFVGTEKEWLESLKEYTPIKRAGYWIKTNIEEIKMELKDYINALLKDKE